MIGRRNFLKSSALTMAGTLGFLSLANSSSAVEKHSFKLKYAPHLSFMSNIKDEIDRLEVYASYGFKAFEFNGLMGWTTQRAGQLRKKMDQLGMEMGVFTANPSGWNKSRLVDPSQRDFFLEEITKAMTYVDITGNKRITVITGMEMQKATRGEQIVSIIEGLRRATDIAAKHNVVLCLEMLNILTDHPGYFLSRSDEGFEIITAVNSPNVKMLFDIYHQQITEGNLITNIRKFKDGIGTFHFADVPGRMEPGTGEINYRNVFKAIYELKFDAFLGVELRSSVKQDPEGSEKVFQSIVEADNF